MYNSFILWKKVNPDKQDVDHLSYRKLLIEEIIMLHAFGGQSRAKSCYYESKSNQTN